MDLEAELHQGIECQQAGRLGDAVRHYRAVLQFDPTNVDALNLMSVLALTAGDGANAAALAESARTYQPDWFLSYLNLGNALQTLGRMDEAVDAFQKAITLNPDSAESFVNLSAALDRAGRHDDAADMAVKAIMIAPDMADAHVNFGNALLGLGSPGEAVEAYVKATGLEPDNALAWFNLGNAHAALAEWDEAIGAYRRAVTLADGPVKQFNLGNALRAALRLDEAEAAFSRALEHDATFLDALINLGAVQRDRGRLDEAEATLRQALERYPDEAELHWNLALVLLTRGDPTRGDWAEGWREYEWRWRTPHFARFNRSFSSAAWRGETLAGRSILVHSEQGFGDALEVARLVPRLCDQGARVVLECRTGLGRLFGTLDLRIQIVEGQSQPLPETDFHVALMSLPLHLALTIDGIGACVPYLRAPDGAGDFSDIAGQPGIKVGVVWSGSATRGDNTGRSFTPHDLAGLPGARLFSLQKGAVAATASDLFDFGRMVDLAPRLSDFADTAAAITALDLVISADTAVAHLAGALGKPVWVLLPNPTGAFLWMNGRDDSPWYPRLRLFRQPSPGDWAGALASLRRAFAADFGHTGEPMN
jgi:tetratricopeptide (TPR) repeat protein